MCVSVVGCVRAWFVSVSKLNDGLNHHNWLLVSFLCFLKFLRGLCYSRGKLQHFSH